MRVSSLSDDRIIGLITRTFIPVWLSRDNYQLDAPTPADRTFLAKIDASRRSNHLPSGAVCVYLVKPSGEAFATLTVQQASKPERLLTFLRSAAAEGKWPPRRLEDVQAARRMPPTSRTKAKPGCRTVTIWTRFDDRSANRGTSRDTVELTREEWSAFVPPMTARVGHRWIVPRTVAEKFLRYGYPPLPRWQADLFRVKECDLRGRVESLSEGIARMRLEGSLELIYPDRGGSDSRVTARLVGLVEADMGRRTLKTLLLTSIDGRFIWTWQGKPQPRVLSLAVCLDP